MMDDHFSFPEQPMLKRQPFVYSTKEDPDTVYEVSKMGDVPIKLVQTEKVSQAAQQEKGNEIRQNLGIRSYSPTQVHQLVPVLLDELTSMKEEENEEGGETSDQISASVENDVDVPVMTTDESQEEDKSCSSTETARTFSVSPNADGSISTASSEEIAEEKIIMMPVSSEQSGVHQKESSISTVPEKEIEEAVQQNQEQKDEDFVLVGSDVLAAKPSEDPSDDRILYSKERVSIPYDPEFFPGIDYPNHEVSIPQEGHFIAGTKTLGEFSEQILDNMVHLIKRENQANKPYEQLKRDIRRASFYLEEQGGKRPLLAVSSSSAPAEGSLGVGEKEKAISRPTMAPQDQAVFNLEVFIGNKALARAIGCTLHQTLFTFFPDITTNKEIVGLPRPSSQSEQGTQAVPEYTLEKKQESGNSKPVFIITATSSADVAGFTFKDPSSGEISTFLFGDLPPGRSLHFKQTASIAITLEVHQNDQFDPKKSWSKENFPCSVKCIGYINVYISNIVEPSTKEAGEQLKNVHKQAADPAGKFEASLSGARDAMARGVWGLLDRGKQAVQSLQEKK